MRRFREVSALPDAHMGSARKYPSPADGRQDLLAAGFTAHALYQAIPPHRSWKTADEMEREIDAVIA